MAKVNRLPPNSARIIAEKLRQYQRQEHGLRDVLDQQFREYFESFATEVERWFYRHFVAPFPRTSREKPLTWDLAVAPTAQAELTALFAEGLAEVQDEADEVLDDELDAFALAGYEQGLWELYLGGIDGALDADPPDDGELDALLATAAIGGLIAADRLAAWTQFGVGRVRQALASSIGGGLTLDETRGLLDAGLRLTRTGILGLGSNEAFIAMALGGALAGSRFGVGWVWVTSEDERVCPICLPLHLEITTKVPIVDTHVNCRCWRVPLSQRPSRAFQPFDVFRSRRAA